MLPGPTASDRRIRIVLADSSAVFLQIVHLYLDSFVELHVVGVAQSGPEALGRILQLDPHLALLELQMPGIDGLTVIRHARAQAPQVRIVVLTIHDTTHLRAMCLKAGAHGFLSKHALHAELPRLLRTLFPDSPLATVPDPCTLAGTRPSPHPIASPTAQTSDDPPASRPAPVPPPTPCKTTTVLFRSRSAASAWLEDTTCHSDPELP